MTIRTTFLAGLTATLLAGPVLADTISVKDPFARSAHANAPTGAAFMEIVNTGSEDDRLVAARSDIAERVELHTHRQVGDGIMRMMEVEEGFPIPAGGTHKLARGGDHVMFLGLKRALSDGMTIPVTLSFERAGDLVVDIPVDNTRQPAHGNTGHGKTGQGQMGHGSPSDG